MKRKESWRAKGLNPSLSSLSGGKGRKSQRKNNQGEMITFMVKLTVFFPRGTMDSEGGRDGLRGITANELLSKNRNQG